MRGGVAELAEQEHLPIIGPHEGDLFWIQGLGEQSRRFGFKPSKPFVPTRWLQQGDTVQVGKLTLGGPSLSRTHARACHLF
jgi:hydroxyacylglutathione hydrolase